jgi:Leucine-rich repeat (LRR) protein
MNNDSIDAHYAELTMLPIEIGTLKYLTVLDLSGNFLNESVESSVQEIGKNLNSLKYLDLSCNDFTKMPIEICNLNLLEMWDFSANKLIELPSEIGNLRLLKELYIADNELINLPFEICNLNLLEILNVSDNKLTGLSESLIREMSECLHSLNDFSIKNTNKLSKTQINCLDKYYGGIGY